VGGAREGGGGEREREREREKRKHGSTYPVVADVASKILLHFLPEGFKNLPEDGIFAKLL
jgi:hypothetical protein